MRNKVEEKKSEGKESQPANQPPPGPPLSAALPPSASSSPSHEFSFTISLHPSASTIPNKTKAPPSIAIDLSPADDIFFHGHLLPLHLLSHLPVSPRTSTNSLDHSFTLPIKELLEEQTPNKSSTSTSTSSRHSHSHSHNNSCNSNSFCQSNIGETKGRTKSKSFSLFGLSKWRKGCEVREEEDKEKQKKKPRFDVSDVLKSSRGRQQLRGRRGEFSAPASMRTSPTNSGLLLATGSIPTSTSDSTMEELQAAIQAAITHCKNSIAMEEKIKC
ncbi:hypothetical protein F0562_035901 [Nyssa sinensis]|uniref:BRI1 kinase inhibitor 1 n=1 Tax=Nyssa sinensis TaxID=561372 RepID=A0A5J5AFQ9_9ASTE|nr:hypothetical protein F0562_035901 [Nyssa sinensis]